MTSCHIPFWMDGSPFTGGQMHQLQPLHRRADASAARME
jgi:hypothetical protein